MQFVMRTKTMKKLKPFTVWYCQYVFLKHSMPSKVRLRTYPFFLAGAVAISHQRVTVYS